MIQGDAPIVAIMSVPDWLRAKEQKGEATDERC